MPSVSAPDSSRFAIHDGGTVQVVVLDDRLPGVDADAQAAPGWMVKAASMEALSTLNLTGKAFSKRGPCRDAVSHRFSRTAVVARRLRFAIGAWQDRRTGGNSPPLDMDSREGYEVVLDGDKVQDRRQYDEGVKELVIGKDPGPQTWSP